MKTDTIASLVLTLLFIFSIYPTNTVSMLKVWHDAAKSPTAVRAHYPGQGDTKHSSHSKTRWREGLTQTAETSQRESTLLVNHTL